MESKLRKLLFYGCNHLINLYDFTDKLDVKIDPKNPQNMQQLVNEQYVGQNGSLKNASVISYTRDGIEEVEEDLHVEGAVRIRRSDGTSVFPLMVAGEDISGGSRVIARGTNFRYLHEFLFSVGNKFSLSLGSDELVNMADVIGYNVPGKVRKSLADTFTKNYPGVGSMRDQVKAALEKLPKGSELEIDSHSMGAGMAPLVLAMAIESGRFKSVRLVQYGALKSVDFDAKKYLEAKAMCLGFSITGDLIPHMNDFVDIFFGIFPGDKPTANIDLGLVTLGTQFRATIHPALSGSTFLTRHAIFSYASGFSTEESFKVWQQAKVMDAAKAFWSCPTIIPQKRDALRKLDDIDRANEG